MVINILSVTESPRRYISDETVGGFIYVPSMSQKIRSDRSGAKGFTSVSEGAYRKLVLLLRRTSD